MNTNKQSWESIYRNGNSCLKYPSQTLVILYHRVKMYLPKTVTCLDYGFGSGNNSEFLIEKVDAFYGVETSPSAKEITCKRLKNYAVFKKENLILVSSDDYIESYSNKFDLIVAWNVVDYNTLETLKATINNLFGYLKKTGILIVTMATQNDTSQKNSTPLSHNTYLLNNNINGQAGCTVVIPQNEKEFEAYFHQFKVRDIGCEERISYKKNDFYSHYYGVFEK